MDDSQRFILDCFDVIFGSPSRLYHYLPFSPSSSWLRECYSSELSRALKVVGGLPAEWGMCSRTVSGFNGDLFALACWKDTIAIGWAARSITILDAITGARTAVLPGHTGGVRSLSFSSDGALLVSGSEDETVKLWDTQTGGVVKTFDGRAGSVLSVSISPDCKTIASGVCDGTIHIWDLQTGERLRIVGGIVVRSRRLASPP